MVLFLDELCLTVFMVLLNGTNAKVWAVPITIAAALIMSRCKAFMAASRVSADRP